MYKIRDEVRQDVFDYIEMFYNPKRKHVRNGMLSSGAFSSISKLAVHHNEDPSEVSRLLPFAFPAPDIVTAILQGTQPVNLTAKKLRLLRFLPHDWVTQRQILEFPSIQ